MKLLSTLFLLTYLSLSHMSSQISFYISPEGSDENPGTQASPFETIEKAQTVARKTRGVVNLYLRQGQYQIDNPIVFTPEDSREEQEPLTLRSFPGEMAVVSGSVSLQLDWSIYRNEIWLARIDPSIEMDQLYVNGELQQMARYPNFHKNKKPYGGTGIDAFDSSRVAAWSHPEGGYIHALHKHEWGGYHYLIEGKDAYGALILSGGYQNNRKMGMHEEHRFVENIFEELDTIGEWYYDDSVKLLYFYPSPNLNLHAAKVEVPQLKHLFEFRGAAGHPVQNITIADLQLKHTRRTFMENKEPLLRSDWTIYRGGAIVFEGAEKCAIVNCNINSVGSNAIFFSNYNRHHEVSGNHIYDAGASAICFVGDPGAVRSPSFEYQQFVELSELDLVPGPQSNNFPANCTVYNNLIHDIGITEKQVAGVQISMSQFITVTHNTIYNVPRAGINIGDGTWGGHIIEYNDVFNTVQETGDHGSFNSWGRDRYWHPNYDTMTKIVAHNPELILLDAVETTIIRNNRFRCDHGWDVDLDDGSSNYHIYNNLCLNGGIKLREGFYRKVENNIMINNSFHPHVWFKNSGDVFIHNIVTRPYAPIRLLGWGQEIDFNLFPDSTSLEQARKSDTDGHSLYGNPGFINSGDGDFRVSMDSPASKLGFKNFAMDSFGVLNPYLKQFAMQVAFPALDLITNENPDESQVDWQGLTIKNLSTEGERSSTGMSEIRGVLVLKIESWSLFNQILHPGDVILSYANKNISKLDDLTTIEEVLLTNMNTKIVIFRNQKEQLINL